MTLTNARPLPRQALSISTATSGLCPFNASTVEGWLETAAVLRDPAFKRDVEEGLAEVERGDRLYSFEEIFGEPPRGS